MRSVDEFVDEGIPEKEPRFDDEEADVQRALEKSLKSVYDAPRGLLPSMVIREPDSGKYQLLLEVQRKGKEKVSDDQVALDLLTLQTPKKKSPTDQYIFQRRTSTPTESSGHDESSSLYVELGLTDTKVESDEDVPGIDAGVQDEGQANHMSKMKARLDQTLVMLQRLNLNQVLLFMLDQTLNTWTLRPQMSPLNYTMSRWMKGSLQLPTRMYKIIL
nr:hypothetical protein [Tanacetum cinerariifolium]